MAYTPVQIQQAMQKARDNSDAVALGDLRKMLKFAYENEDYGSAASESGIVNLGMGLTSGIDEAARGLANLLPESLQPSWGTDEAVQERLDLNRDLKDTGAGMAGNLIGSIAATAPIGAGVGGLALKAGARLLPKALSAAGKGAKIGRGMVQGIAQGATEGAIIASPDDKGFGAGVGAAFGMAMPLVARTAGALVRKLGRPASKTTAQADELILKMKDSGIEDPFIPLSHSAPPGIIRQLYQGIVANIPGNKIRVQHGEAVDDFRQAVLHEVVPDGVDASIIFESGDDIVDGFRRLSRAWDETWDVVNKAEIMIPQGIVPDSILKQAAKATKGQFTVPPPGRGTGRDLTRLSKKFQELADMQVGTIGEDDARMFITMKNHVDDVLAKLLPKEGAIIWRANKNKYSTYQDLLAGAKGKMGSGEFTPKALSQATARRSGQVGGKEGNVLQDLGQLGEKVLEDFPSKQGVFQSLAATGAAGGLAAGAYAFADDYPVLAGVAAFLTPFVGARLASKPGFQKALTGGWARARRAGMKADEYKKFLESMGFTSRQITIGLAVGE